MSRRLILAAIFLTVAGAAHAVTTNDAVTAEREGRELVRQLRGAQPPQDFTNRATIRIQANKQIVEVPVMVETFLTPTNWETFYFTAYPTQGTNKGWGPSASVRIRHTAEQPNEYRSYQFNRSPCDSNESDLISGDQTFLPFAGSDFWLADLGLEFLQWPEQKVWRKELKKGQSCAVLESRPAAPATNGYSRVVSWVDIDTGGIVEAEAYDAKGKRLKEFEVKELEKINGRLEVTELQMRNVQTGSRTLLRFDFTPRN